MKEPIKNNQLTQEELEIAQASGERLVDAQAGAAVANRLMALQRRRFAQSQVIDQHTRPDVARTSPSEEIRMFVLIS